MNQNRAEKAIRNIVSDAMRDYHEKLETLTEEQLRTCFRQAIDCGDFQAHVSESQRGYEMHVGVGMSYVPFRQKEELLRLMKRLEEKGHDKGCEIFSYTNSHCTCGLDYLLKERE